MSTLVPCPHCGKQVNPKSIFCPFCNGSIKQPLSPIEPLCPRCGSKLQMHGQDGLELDLCPSCGGLWLDRGEFKAATSESLVYRTGRSAEEYSRPMFRPESGYMDCVRCGGKMTRKNFGRISGVIIDECGRHGVWLDAGELEKIRHFILAGGLEDSQNREIEKNRQELRELAVKVQDTAFTHKLIHYWDWRRWFFGGW